MKKAFFLLSLFLIPAGAFFAQAQDRKHDVSITIGGPTGGYRYISGDYYYSERGSDLYGLYKTTESYNPAGAFIVGYTYRLSDQFTVGGDAALGLYDLEIRQGSAARNRKTVTHEATVVSLMPVGEWYYFRDGGADLYMRAGFGAELSFGGHDGTRLRPCWQITPLGVHVGSKTYFIGELGVGTEYLLRLGFGFRF